MYTKQYLREQRVRAVGWVLVIVGTVMAAVHVVTHLGRLRIVGFQDLLLGYPMAAVLILVGIVLVGRAART